MLSLIIFGGVIWTLVGTIAWFICMNAILNELYDRPINNCQKWYGNTNCFRFSILFILFSLPFGPCSTIISIATGISIIWNSTIVVAWNKLITPITDKKTTIEEIIFKKIEMFAVAFLNKFLSPYSPPEEKTSHVPYKVEKVVDSNNNI